jgi:hypothetical protein
MSTSELGLWPKLFSLLVVFYFNLLLSLAQSQDDNPGDAFLQEREVAQADGLGRVRNWPTRIITQFSKIADEENWVNFVLIPAGAKVWDVIKMECPNTSKSPRRLTPSGCVNCIHFAPNLR